MIAHDNREQCARQLVTAQAERDAWRAKAEQWHTRAMEAEATMSDLQAEIARLQAGLREIKVDIAAQSLHSGNSNATRAALARLETRIEHLLHAAPEAPSATDATEVERLNVALRGVWQFAAVAALEDSYGKRAREAFFTLTEQVEAILLPNEEQP